MERPIAQTSTLSGRGANEASFFYHEHRDGYAAVEGIMEQVEPKIVELTHRRSSISERVAAAIGAELSADPEQLIRFFEGAAQNELLRKTVIGTFFKDRALETSSSDLVVLPRLELMVDARSKHPNTEVRTGGASPLYHLQMEYAALLYRQSLMQSAASILTLHALRSSLPASLSGRKVDPLYVGGKLFWEEPMSRLKKRATDIFYQSVDGLSQIKSPVSGRAKERCFADLQQDIQNRIVQNTQNLNEFEQAFEEVFTEI